MTRMLVEVLDVVEGFCGHKDDPATMQHKTIVRPVVDLNGKLAAVQRGQIITWEGETHTVVGLRYTHFVEQDQPSGVKL